MRKILFAIILSGLLFIPLTGDVFGQTETDNESEFNSLETLRSDMKMSNVTAYVDVKKLKLVDSMGSGDCEKNTGAGYCLYELEADVKEIFKGKIKTKTINFFTGPDADYPKERLMGEQVVFLIWNKPEKGKTAKLSTIENSTRKTDVLAKMRKIVKQKR
jgi:hypothetical protein